MARSGFTMILPAIMLFSACTSSLPTDEKLMNGIDSIAGIWVPDTRENLLSAEVRRLPGNIYVVKGETNLPEARNAIVDFLKGSGVVYADSIKVLPDTSVNVNKWGLVTVSVCNMKKTPSYASELVSQAVMGTPVKILKRSNGWILCQSPDNYLGWINESSIAEKSDPEIESWRSSKRLICMDKSCDIYSADKSGAFVSDIVAGSILTDDGGNSENINVTLPDGRRGIISRDMTVDFDKWSATIQPEPDKLISFATTFLGRSYLWGGTSVYAMDCSGFAKTVYFRGGIILARDASQQALHGIEVDITSSIDKLEPADLVFFGSLNRDGRKRITHVGIYIGDTEVIHSSGMVRINSLDTARSNYSEYLGRRIMGARRIIGAGPENGIIRIAHNGWYTNQK